MSTFDRFKKILEERSLTEAEVVELRALSLDYALANPLPIEAVSDLGVDREKHDLIRFWTSTMMNRAWTSDVTRLARLKQLHGACADAVVKTFNPKFQVKDE